MTRFVSTSLILVVSAFLFGAGDPPLLNSSETIVNWNPPPQGMDIEPVGDSWTLYIDGIWSNTIPCSPNRSSASVWVRRNGTVVYEASFTISAGTWDDGSENGTASGWWYGEIPLIRGTVLPGDVVTVSPYLARVVNDVFITTGSGAGQSITIP